MRTCTPPPASRPAPAGRCRCGSRGGFSLVEMLIALAITGALLAATLGALDASFKSYQHTTESASTHVVSRIVMQRLTGMIRSGERFGPYPVNPILTPETLERELEFIVPNGPGGGAATARIYLDPMPEDPQAEDIGQEPRTLRIEIRPTGGGATIDQPLLENVLDAKFRLQWNDASELVLATVDMVVRPDDLQDAAVSVGMEGPTIRLFTSASPQGIVGE